MSSVALVQVPDIEEIIFPQEVEKSRDTSFQIDDQEKASWAARRILQSQRRIDERQNTAKQFKQRIDSWLTQANRGDEETIARLEAILEPYLEEELDGKKKGKSLQHQRAIRTRCYRTL